MTIDSIKFFLKNKNNNFENKEVEINILNKNEEIENICEDDGDKKKLKNKEIKNSLSENNDVISENNPKTDSDKIILLKNFKKENKFFSINILLYFNENLYDFFLYDMNSFFWYILIIIIFVIFIAEINNTEKNKKNIILLYFIYFIILSTISINAKLVELWFLPIYILLFLININLLLSFNLYI